MKCGRRWRQLFADTRGAAAIEFAIAIGVLVAILVASLQLGSVLLAKSEMNHALARVVRVIHLEPDTAATEIEAKLLAALGADAVLEVRVAPVSGTNYMRIAVAMPFQLSIPFSPIERVMLTGEALAPILRAQQ